MMGRHEQWCELEIIVFRARFLGAHLCSFEREYERLAQVVQASDEAKELTCHAVHA